MNRICWCPCNCGCKEPNWEVNESGLCPCCEQGNHEIAPASCIPSREQMLKQFESIVLWYKKVIARDEQEENDDTIR